MDSPNTEVGKSPAGHEKMGQMWGKWGLSLCVLLVPTEFQLRQGRIFLSAGVAYSRDSGSLTNTRGKSARAVAEMQ